MLNLKKKTKTKTKKKICYSHISTIQQKCHKKRPDWGNPAAFFITTDNPRNPIT